MSGDWYMAWAADHCHKFGFRDADAQMVLAWREVFEMLFTADELRAATGHLLAAGDTPRFASDHRGAIIRAVESARQASARKAFDSTAPSGCEACGGCGIVIVPHPGLTDDGREWRGVLRTPDADPTGLTRTAGVCCQVCKPGHRTREATEKQGRPLLTMAQYEHRYPYWREVQFAREQVLKASRAPATREDVERLNALLRQARDHAAKKAA